MTQTKNKKENLYMIFNEQGTLRIKKIQGQQLIDSPEVYCSKIGERNYQLIHKPTGLLITWERTKKSLFEQWENKFKEKFEKVDLNTKYYRKHIEIFENLIQDYENSINRTDGATPELDEEI